MGNVVYEYRGERFIVIGRDKMKVVLENIDTGAKIKVTGQKFMSDQFRVCARI